MALQPIGLDATITGVPDFTGGIDKMNRAVDSFADNSTKQGGMFSGGFGEIVSGALRKVGELGVQALLKAGQAIAGFVKDSIGLAGDFEANMLQFQSVAGKSVDLKGLEQFRDLFLDIGKRLPVSTSEVQQAAIEMVKGGIDPATIAAGGLEQNIQFAAAAMGGDLVKAAEISSKILGGWAGVNATAAEKADFLTHATDLLTKAANASSTDVEGLSRGIFQAQGIARTAGVSFDDLTTTLAELAPRFASSAEAGTSLKNMIVRLQPTTDPAISAMTRLGLYTQEAGSAFYDAQGNFVGFERASQLLQDSLKGLTKEQQAATLQTIFGNDAMGSAAGLAELGAQGYQNMAAALENANGVAAAAELKQQGFNTALDNAKGSVEALQITIGTALLPILTSLLNDHIAPLVNGVTSFAEAFMKMVPAIEASDDPFQTFLNALKVAAPQFLDTITSIESFKDTVVSIATPIMEVASVIADRLEPVVLSIGASLRDLISTFSDGGQGADGLGGALDKLNGVWQLALKVITDVMAGYKAIVDSVLPIIQKLWTDHGTEISAFVKTTFDSIIKIVTLALQLYQAVVPPILNAIAGFFRAHASEIELVLSGAGEAIGAIVTGFMETVSGVFQLALDLINGDWDAAWGDIETITTAQTTSIGGVVTGFLNMIAGLFNTSMADIGKTWENNWNMLIEIANKVGARMVEAGANIVAGIVQGIENNASAIYAVLEDIAQRAIDAFLEAIGAKSPAKEFMPAGEYAMQGVMMGMEGTLPALTDLIEQTGTTMINALKKNIQKGGDEIRKMMADLTAEIKDISSQINDAIADGFGATASIDRQIAKNLDKFKDIPDKYKQYTEGALKEAQTVAAGFADPTQGAKFFKMRSDQILEFAKLQQDLAEAETQEDADRIQQQMILINAAQTQEIRQWEALQAAMTTPMEDIAAQIQALFNSNELAGQLPGILENQLIAQLTSLMQQLQSPPGVTRTPYNPGATNTTNTTTLNMPIYTNQSAGVLQDSMAIAGAALL